MSRVRIRDIRNEELTTAAISAVHQYGFAQVTLNDIATHANASAASINYYFGTKEKLMEATMRRLLAILKTAMLERYAEARSPRDRLLALIDANFDDRLFTAEQCSVWVQFWSHAPYAPELERLQRINRSRVQSHIRAELRQLLPENQQEAAAHALQSYMDGVWLEAAQSAKPVDAAKTRASAAAVVELLIGVS